MSESACDYLFKVILIGDAGVGKSCLLGRFIENTFQEKSQHTIGVEFGSRIIQLGGVHIKLQIWDTAGQERFRSVTQSYYKGAAAVVLVYDITNRSTFQNLETWLTDTRNLANEQVSIMLVGSKADLERQREVSFMEASQFALDHDLKFLESSSLSGAGVEEIFLTVAKSVLSKVQRGEIDLGKSASLGVLKGNREGIVLGDQQSGSSQEGGCSC